MSEQHVTYGPRLRGSSIPRPTDAGYCISLYDDLRRWIRDGRQEIAMHERAIASHQAALTKARRELEVHESTLAWMQEHQADEIAEVEAHRERIRAFLREADLNDTAAAAPPTSGRQG